VTHAVSRRNVRLPALIFGVFGVVSLLHSGAANASVATTSADSGVELELRPLLHYSKGSISFRVPRSGAIGSRDDIGIWQPNVAPAIGLAVSWGRWLSLSASRQLETFEARRAERGSSRVHHVEIHSEWRGIGLDAWHQNYRGFFQSRVPLGEPALFRDALFSTSNASGFRPDMEMRVTGVAATMVPRRETFSIRDALLHQEKPKESGWSFLANVRGEDLRIRSPEAIGTADDIADWDARLHRLSGIRGLSAAALPGIAGVALLGNSWYVSGAALWGLALQRARFRDTDVNEVWRLGSAGQLRGAVVRHFGRSLYGLNGHKGVSTWDAGGLQMTQTVSSVELFAAWRY